MAKLFNLAGMSTATTGTGTITLGSAVYGHLTFAQAGVQDGDLVGYAVKDGAASEVGYGVYTASGTTLTRTVRKSTNSNSAISLSGSAEVFITPAAEDFLGYASNGGMSGFRNRVLNPNFAINQEALGTSLTLSAGSFARDGWKAGASGCTCSLATSGGVTTVTITAGTLVQVVEGGWSIDISDTYCLSWAGTAQARIDGGSYSNTGMTASLTGGTNATIEFGTGTVSLVQLERGTAPTLFESRPQIEKELCRRYFRIYGGNAAYEFYPFGYVQSSTLAYVLFPVEGIRVSPSLTVSAATDFGLNGGSGGHIACTAISVGVTGTFLLGLSCTVAGGLTVGQVVFLQGGPNTDHKLKFSARL